MSAQTNTQLAKVNVFLALFWASHVTFDKALQELTPKADSAAYRL